MYRESPKNERKNSLRTSTENFYFSVELWRESDVLPLVTVFRSRFYGAVFRTFGPSVKTSPTPSIWVQTPKPPNLPTPKPPFALAFFAPSTI